jgi:hypothetical protein
MTVLIMNDEETPISTKKVVVAIYLGIPPILIKWLIDWNHITPSFQPSLIKSRTPFWISLSVNLFYSNLMLN